MPHQNVQSPKATAQNAVTPSREPSDDAQGELDLRAEPRSYAASDVSQSTLAAPAAGEVADDMDEGDALDAPGVQQGGTHASRPVRTEARRGRGRLAGSGCALNAGARSTQDAGGARLEPAGGARSTCGDRPPSAAVLDRIGEGGTGRRVTSSKMRRWSGDSTA